MTLPSIGDLVDGKFRIERQLGEGGTSTIYEVRHAITDKRFALKWLAPELAQNELAVHQFIHEAKVCGRLEHPNAVQIYDICRNRDSYYLVMELLEGESLETRLHRVQRLSVRAACDILLPCTEALGAAHRLGIVHRDLKPSNIFLCNVEGRTEELPKVLDFGISKLTYRRSDQGSAQSISGTPLYMAPEQMRGQPADPRFDIYALGIVLYEIVAGRPPFDSESLEELAGKIMESEPVSLDKVVQVAPEFAEIVTRAMAREVEDRFATMAELAHALRPYGTPRPNPSSPALESQRSEPPAAPVRRSMKATQPGVWVIMPEAAAAMAELAEPPLGDAEAEAESRELDSRLPAPSPEVPSIQQAQPSSEILLAFAESAPEMPLVEPESAPEMLLVEPESAPEMLLAFAESAPEMPLVEPESAPEMPLVEPDSSSEIPLIEAEPEPDSVPLLPLASAAESGPRARVVPGPITVPPPAASTARRRVPPPAAVVRSEVDELDDLALAGAHRSRGKRWLGTAIAIGGAFLTWYGLTRTPARTPPPAPTSAPHARPALPEADTTAMRAAPATAEVSTHRAVEPAAQVQPRRTQLVKSVAKAAEPARAKPARRPSKPKRNTAKESAPSKPEPSEQGLSLPSADLSRQDF